MGVGELLFPSIMRGEWDIVVANYHHADMQRQEITSSQDTALHMAVRFGKTEIVQQLVEQIEANDARQILELFNDKGDTVLHLAAALGNVDICSCIATKYGGVELMKKQNFKGETPLFMAVLHGKEKVFFYLDSKNKNGTDYSLCTRKNGDTILHTAIFQEHFGLALHIIKGYPDLVNNVNRSGFSALHILASKPNAFKSNSHLDLLDRFIYLCMEAKDRLNRALPGSGPETPSWGRRPRDENNPQAEALPGYGRMIKNLCAAICRHVCTITQTIYAATLTSVSKILKVATFGFLDVKREISRVIWWITNLREVKRKHKLAMLLLDKLVVRCSIYYSHSDPENSRHAGNGFLLLNAAAENPDNLPNSASNQDQENVSEGTSTNTKKETPILTAARMGIPEVVKKILQKFPVASLDLDSDDKNVVLLATENRQIEVYKFLLKVKRLKENMFIQVDCQGNSALHLAATFNHNRRKNFPEAATHMRWEVVWYEFVKHSMPPQFFVTHNKKGEMPDEIFSKTHKKLVKSGSQWFVKTSESCSVVAALIATVAFASSKPVPGGTNRVGLPIFLKKPLFDVFAISSLLALCFSVTSLVYFLAIRTSRFKKNDFAGYLPKTLFMGLASLFASMASILVSFCSSHSLMLGHELKSIALPVYAFTGFTVIILAFFQVPFYVSLLVFNL